MVYAAVVGGVSRYAGCLVGRGNRVHVSGWGAWGWCGERVEYVGHGWGRGRQRRRMRTAVPASARRGRVWIGSVEAGGGRGAGMAMF